MQGVSARADDWLTIDGFANRIRDVVLKTVVTGDQKTLREGLTYLNEGLKACHESGNKVILIGNGGSSAICSHLAIDLSKNHKVRAISFNDFPTLLCLANDFGFDHVFVKQLEFHARPGDCLICISSSGKSINIRSAASYGREHDLKVFTLTGMREGNPLSNLGHVNFWVPATDYGIVELAHATLLHSLVHCCI